MALEDLQAAVANLEAAQASETAELGQLVTEAQGLSAQVAQLEQQVASGGGVSAADLDELTTRVATLTTAATNAVSAAQAGDPANVTPSPAPAPGPTPGPTPDPNVPTPDPTPSPAPDPNAPVDPTPAPSPGPAQPDRTVYVFDGDPSTVDAATWTLAPFVTEETPPRQLYYFAGDAAPGDRNGDGVQGQWHAYDSPVQAAPGTGEA